MGLSDLLNKIDEFKISVGEVINEAAELHAFTYGADIDAFVLPNWMYKKLSTEDGFQEAGCAWIGQYCGRTVYRHDSKTKPLMKEKGGNFVWGVL